MLDLEEAQQSESDGVRFPGSLVVCIRIIRASDDRVLTGGPHSTDTECKVRIMCKVVSGTRTSARQDPLDGAMLRGLQHERSSGTSSGAQALQLSERALNIIFHPHELLPRLHKLRIVAKRPWVDNQLQEGDVRVCGSRDVELEQCRKDLRGIEIDETRRESVMMPRNQPDIPPAPRLHRDFRSLPVNSDVAQVGHQELLPDDSVLSVPFRFCVSIERENEPGDAQIVVQSLDWDVVGAGVILGHDVVVESLVFVSGGYVERAGHKMEDMLHSFGSLDSLLVLENWGVRASFDASLPQVREFR